MRRFLRLLDRLRLYQPRYAIRQVLLRNIIWGELPDVIQQNRVHVLAYLNAIRSYPYAARRYNGVRSLVFKIYHQNQCRVC